MDYGSRSAYSSKRVDDLPLPSLDEIIERSAKHRAWQPRNLPLAEAMKKSWENSKKAIVEHTLSSPKGYAPLTEALPSVEVLMNPDPSVAFTFECYAAEQKGTRVKEDHQKIEDTHFYALNKLGLLAGVIDGHAGFQVANYVRETFPVVFDQALKSGKHAHAAFEYTVDAVQQLISQNEKWDLFGAAAVFSFIDNYGRIFTATLSDCESNLYPKDQNGSIPLSCIRNFSSKNDADRIAVIKEDPSIAAQWPKAKNPKYLRYPFPYLGVNTSRAFGDVNWKGNVPGTSGVFHKPKITVNLVKEGWLIMASDGLKDVVKEKEILSILHKTPDDEVPQALINFAVKKNEDDVTVIAIKISKATAPSVDSSQLESWSSALEQAELPEPMLHCLIM
jgi:serine/threonine protein phosphatase PrpC